MKRVLVFSFFPAFVPPSNGGESRLYNFYKSLSRYHHVTLLTSTFLNVDEEKIYHGSNFIERRIPKDHFFSKKWDELIPYSSGGDLSAVCITASGQFHTLLHDAYLDEYDAADIIIHDSPFTVDYDLFFDVDDKVRIYNSYNCETSLYKTLHPEPKSKPICDLIHSAEVKLLDGCDALLYCSEDDLNEFKKISPSSTYTAIFAPNGMSPLSNIVKKKSDEGISSVVFMGSGHKPNVDAALQITNNIAPDLPHIKFHVIGNCLPKGKYPKNVIRHGFISDEQKEELVSGADLAINPMGIGSGSNVKVCDFFSFGTPVLSSEFGMRGIDASDGINCLITPVSDFSKTIDLWSGRYDELKKIGLNGQKFAIENYSWDVIANNVSKQFSNIKRNKTWTEKFILALNDYDSFRSTGGGGVRTRGIYAAINEWCPVVFISFSDTEELTVRYENEQTIVFNIPKTRDHLDEVKSVNSCFHVSAQDIVAHRHCISNRLLVRIYEVLKNHSRNVVVEHPYMASLPILFKDRFVYSSQNNETLLKKDLLKHHPLYDELIRDVETIERKAVEYSSAVIAVSEHDANSFVIGAKSAGPVIVSRNGASSPEAATNQELKLAGEYVAKERSAVFIGSTHMPNIEAVKYIVDTLAPATPTIEYHIIGTVCNVFQSDKTENIRFWGVLSESMKSAVMQSCGIGINTVISGGGSNIKLADYFANGLFVVTTPFGIRGYPDEVRKHLIISELSEFEFGVNESLIKISNEDDGARSRRRQLFTDSLSMKSKALDIVHLLKNLDKPKKKVLFVTYRYTCPTYGGAEDMIENLIKSLDRTDDYQIDIVAPEVSKIRSLNRFSEQYEFDEKVGAKTGLRNVRFARFQLDNSINVTEKVKACWLAQSLFETEVYIQLIDSYEYSGLAWGWGDPCGETRSARWGFTSCGLYLHKISNIHMKCYTPVPIVIWVKNDHGYVVDAKKVVADFDLSFISLQGTIEITTSVTEGIHEDVRPLAFYLSELSFDENDFDLGSPLLFNAVSVESIRKFKILNSACNAVRNPLMINLTDMRGPFSYDLECFIENNVHQYDLVITHNNIFKPAVIAVDIANKAGVPVISIPHVHLDDDFYHFPDVQQSITSSSLVLAAPKEACEFYAQNGANVSYLSAGVNTNEVFSNEDITAFNAVCSVAKPFILILGRKSIAKGYKRVIAAVENIAKKTDIHLVMIGPDDDNLPVTSSCVTYIGMQPREVVRGALLSCIALVNMSTSESFGIVLLEAWMAGKPVIINDECAAFHDLAKDNQNALMVTNDQSLEKAILRLKSDPVMCIKLSENGRNTLKDYDWSNVGDRFVEMCKEMISRT